MGQNFNPFTVRPGKKLVWSKLDLHDFTETASGPKDIKGVVDELIVASPLAEVVVLFYQIDSQNTKIILHTQGPKNALSLVRQYSSEGNKYNAYFSINKNLKEAETEIINHLKSQI